jgi:N-acetyl-1-D-myo-inositol-2-amino-2-deoxy-alpha-D-glucopyranoside deacetylase
VSELSPFSESVRSVLFLHAHPDDETLATGGTIVALAARGLSVTVLTATRGERGEVVAGPLSALAGSVELAAWRERELTLALEALGVTERHYLGESGARRPGAADYRHYLDSGMEWGPDGFAIAAADASPESLSLAPIGEVVDDILALVHRLRPDLIVTYDARGGYGHPDHVRMHDAAVLVSAATGVDLVTVVTDADAGAPGVFGIDTTEQQPAVLRALAAHQSQLQLTDDDFGVLGIVHSGGQRQEITTMEYFRRHPR